MQIKPLSIDQLHSFLAYLQDHISDNGKDGAPRFLPIPRSPKNLPDSLLKSLKTGHAKLIGTLGWRRVLVATDEQDRFMGHIDLASLNKENTSHRAMLGMGVHRDHRKKGLGQKLIAAVIDWAKRETEVEHIDLLVLSTNTAAIALYRKMGFEEYGRHIDKFRIEGDSLNTVMMTRNINK